MIQLNFLQYPHVANTQISSNLSLQALHTNEVALSHIQQLKTNFGFAFLKGFAFTKEGFLGLFLSLQGKISVSLGESQAVIEAAHAYKTLGFELEFIALKRNGELDYENIKPCDYAFVSSYIMDTFVKVDLQKVKTLSGAKLISNISATLDKTLADAIYFDSYKLTGFATTSLLLHQGIFAEEYLGQIDTISVYLLLKAIENFTPQTQFKKVFETRLNETFKENIYYFVHPNETLEYTLHFGLKGIKARQIIRTLSLDEIYVSNGEGCSLGLAKPSRVLQDMGYEEHEARWALSLNFSQRLSQEEINQFVQTLARKYRQIKALEQ